MSEARSLVFPRAIALGARPLTVPGSANVLVVSAFHAFRLADGAHVLPAAWYETVAGHAGADVVPDSMAPLPGAELLVLGAVPPLAGQTRKAVVRCGSLEGRVTLRRDPERPDAPFVPGVAAAVWHEDDNPEGRGGPDDERPALIVSDRDPVRPVWFGPTPFDHPLRLRRVGTPDAQSGAGWPRDADPPCSMKRIRRSVPTPSRPVTRSRWRAWPQRPSPGDCRRTGSPSRPAGRRKAFSGSSRPGSTA